jgi:hypothetical protein
MQVQDVETFAVCRIKKYIDLGCEISHIILSLFFNKKIEIGYEDHLEVMSLSLATGAFNLREYAIQITKNLFPAKKLKGKLPGLVLLVRC